MYLGEKIQILSRQKIKSQFNESNENKFFLDVISNYFKWKLTEKQISVFQRELKFRGVSINIKEYKLTAQYTCWQVSTVHCSGTRERLELCDCTTALLLCVATVEGGGGVQQEFISRSIYKNIQSMGRSITNNVPNTKISQQILDPFNYLVSL